MAIAVTGLAPPSGTTIKVSAGQASGVHPADNFPAYHLVAADGSRVTLRQLAPGIIQLCEGPQGSASMTQLSQQNVNDVLAALVAFANTGTLS